MINCTIQSDCRIIAKLVYCDRFIADEQITLKSPSGDEYVIIVPDEIKDLEYEYTGIHEGLFSIEVASTALRAQVASTALRAQVASTALRAQVASSK